MLATAFHASSLFVLKHVILESDKLEMLRASISSLRRSKKNSCMACMNNKEEPEPLMVQQRLDPMVPFMNKGYVYRYVVVCSDILMLQYCILEDIYFITVQRCSGTNPGCQFSVVSSCEG